MINIKYLRDNHLAIITALKKRQSDGFEPQIAEALTLYDLYTNELSQMENLKAKQKSFKFPEDATLAKENKLIITNMEIKNRDLFVNIETILMFIPNIPSEIVPNGQDETSNQEISKFGSLPVFDFPIIPHYEFTELDFERGAKLSKSRFVVTTGLLAKLERALMNFMLDTHGQNNYEEVTVPFIVSGTTLRGSGQLPKFEADLFKIAKSSELESERDFYLIPTAEAPLANLYAGEIIQRQMPINLMAFSQCFRSEAGSAGKDTRGLIRMHQFGKVELFKYVDPSTSKIEFEKMVKNAQAILELLELPHRTMLLCGGDLGFGATYTYDIEVWMPAQATYRECSSISNVGDFQAVRNKTRFKDADGKNSYPHMLNGSGMATGRILAAIIENFQQVDGTIKIPAVLQKYL